MKLNLFSEWQEYRGGRSLRQLLLIPAYLREEKYIISVPVIDQSHLLLILETKEKRSLLILDRVTNDQTTALDVTFDYLENVSSSIDQWVDASGIFQIELDESPLLIQLIKLGLYDFLVVFMSNARILLWKYEVESMDWLFVCQYPLLTERNIKSSEIVAASFQGRTNSVVWIEKNRQQDHFEEEVLELDSTAAKYRVRSSSIQYINHSIVFAPAITLFTAESFLDHCLSRAFYYFLTEEHQLIVYNFMTGKISCCLLQPFFKDYMHDFKIKLQFLPILDIDEVNTFGKHKDSSKSRETDTKTQLYLLLSSETTLRKCPERRGNYFIYAFQLPISDFLLGKIQLLYRLQLPHSHSYYQVNPVKSISNNSAENSWMVLCNEFDISYICHISGQSNHQLEIFQCCIPHPSIRSTTILIERMNHIVLDFPFKYLHGRELVSNYFSSSFLIQRYSFNADVKSPETNSLSNKNVASRTHPTHSVNLPLLYSDSGFFELSFSLKESSIESHKESLFQILHLAFTGAFSNPTKAIHPTLECRKVTTHSTRLLCDPSRSLAIELSYTDSHPLYYHNLDQFIYDYFLHIKSSPLSCFSFTENYITELVTLPQMLPYKSFGICEKVFYSHGSFKISTEELSCISNGIYYVPPSSEVSVGLNYSNTYNDELSQFKANHESDLLKHARMWNDLHIITLLPFSVMIKDLRLYEESLMKMMDPFLLQQIVSIIIPFDLTTPKINETTSHIDNQHSHPSSSSSFSSEKKLDHGASSSDDECYDDIFIEVASESNGDCYDEEIDLSKIEDASDSLFGDSLFLKEKYESYSNEDPLVRIAENADAVISMPWSEEVGRVYNGRTFSANPPNNVKEVDVPSNLSPTVKNSLPNLHFLSVVARCMVLSSSLPEETASVYHFFYLLSKYQQQLSYLRLTQMELYKEFICSLSSSQNEHSLFFYNDQYMQQPVWQSPQQQQQIFENPSSTQLSLFNQMFFHGFQATLGGHRSPKPHDDLSSKSMDKAEDKAEDKNLKVSPLFEVDSDSTVQLQEIIQKKYKEQFSLHGQQSLNQRNAAPDQMDEDLLGVERSPETQQARKNFLLQISSTACFLLELIVSSLKNAENSRSDLLVEDHDWNVEQLHLLFQLLLLSENYFAIVRYLIYFRKWISLFYFCIRLSTSANVMRHRNIMGIFSTTTEDEISRLYYYQTLTEGKDRKTSDLQVVKEALPSFKSVSEVQEPSSSENKVEEENVEEEEVDDEDVFNVCNMQYFKDRNRQSIESTSRSSQRNEMLPSPSTAMRGEETETTDLNEIRMRDAIKIFYITLEHFFHKIFDLAGQDNVSGEESMISNDQDDLTLLIQLISKIIACRPVDINIEEVELWLESINSKTLAKHETLVHEIIREIRRCEASSSTDVKPITFLN